MFWDFNCADGLASSRKMGPIPVRPVKCQLNAIACVAARCWIARGAVGVGSSRTKEIYEQFLLFRINAQDARPRSWPGGHVSVLCSITGFSANFRNGPAAVRGRQWLTILFACYGNMCCTEFADHSAKDGRAHPQLMNVEEPCLCEEA